MVRVYPYDINTLNTFQFRIKITEETKPVPYFEVHGPYTLIMTCENNKIDGSVTSFMETSDHTNITLLVNNFTTNSGWYEVQFHNFTNNLERCHTFGYFLSSDQTAFENYTDIGVPYFTEGGFTIDVSTKKLRSFNFFIYANDSWGHSNFSQEVNITIEPPPPEVVIPFDGSTL